MKYGTERRIEAIAQTSEKYVSFTIGNLRFVDTFAFMASSLSTLAEALPKDKFTHLKNGFSELLNKLPLNLGEKVFENKNLEEEFIAIKNLNKTIQKRISDRKSLNDINFNNDEQIIEFNLKVKNFEQEVLN